MKHLVLLPLLAALAPACDGPPVYYNPPRVYEAPHGACWGWTCEHGECWATHTDQYCPPVDESGFPECEPGEELGLAWGGGRFFEIYIHCRDPVWGWGIVPHDARPLLCTHSTDCPQLKPGSWYECVSGLCQNDDLERYPRDELRGNDALTLCVGALPRSETVGWPEASYPGTNEVYDAVNAACPDDPEHYSPLCNGELPDYCLVP